MDSLAKFAEWIDGKTDYSVGLCKGSYAFISLNWHEEDYDDFEEGENATLYWITDNLPEKECSFTGYYMDEVLLQPFREYLDNPTEDGLQQLASEAVRLWKKAVEDDMRYQLSDEYIIDTIEANDYEFTVNGELY